MHNFKKNMVLTLFILIVAIKEACIFLLFLLFYFILSKFIPLPERLYVLALVSTYGYRLFKGYENNFFRLKYYLKVKGIKELLEEKDYKD